MTTVTVTTTATIAQPTVDFTGYYGQSCDAGTEEGAGSDGTFVEGECVGLPDQISIDDESFSPGTFAGVTAADCSIVLYTDPACTQEDSTVPATGCIFVGYDFAGMLMCTT